MPRYLTFLTFLLALAATHAQEPALQEVPEVRRYAVEVIIFGYAQEVATGSEIFVAEAPVVEEFVLDELPGARELPVLRESDDAIQGMPPVLESEVVLFEEEQFTMGNILDMLKRLDVYQPLMHFGWIQLTWPEHERETLDIAMFGTPPDGLQGELTLYLSRYLHLAVDLQLDEPQTETSQPGERVLSYGDYRTYKDFGDPLEPGPVRYHIEEDRIFRSGDLRYFDHPKFGVLAKVTRVEEEAEEEQDEQDEGELLGYPLE